MQVYLLKTVVEQLVDDSKTDAVARKLLEEQYAPSLVVGHPPAVVRRWCSSRTRPTKTCLAASNTAPIRRAVHHLSPVAPGALHRANGGFLILEAEKMLSEPFVWDALAPCNRAS
jgi:hypothetical protein